MNNNRKSIQTYILGHSAHELERLDKQAILLEPVTRRYLRNAGIKKGMRVLNVGSGTGEVAFLVRDLVGSAGEAIGTDRAPTAVSVASKSAKERGLDNVEFREGDPSEMTFETPFDAVVGRYVPLYQSDPCAMLRALTHHLTRNGLLVFHEPGWSFVRSFPAAPLYESACRWIVETTLRGGQSWSFLDQTCAAFVGADLPDPKIEISTYAASAANSRDWLMAVGDMVESLLPSIEKFGIATAQQIDLPSLRDRLWQEVSSLNSMVVGRTEIGIWTRTG